MFDGIFQRIHALSESEDVDIFLYSGDMQQSTVDSFMDLSEITRTHERIHLILCTHGGDPDAAYRLIKFLQVSCSGALRVIIAGPCKSAGTLVALGADELSMGNTGELGPLDIQVRKPNEVIRYGSGLDLPKALETLSSSACQQVALASLHFQRYLNLSAAVATESATNLIAEIYKPIAAQIDPLRLGEVRRATEVAEAYARQLRQNNIKDSSSVASLVNLYPSHGFVIDRDEAKKYFKVVKELTLEEEIIVRALSGFTRYPSEESTVLNLTSIAHNHYTSTNHEEQPTADDEDSPSVVEDDALASV